MNYLFYLGIIAPTLITILLFVIFVYCWFLQKARKEVLTKKYDPHGKMRQLGIPMDPPPPPPYCRIDERTHFVDDGLHNEAYDVSRSPSTEQEARGRPLYHTYHDSGISAGLSMSPSQENEPRPGLSYRSCPDSGISGFGVQAAAVSSHPGPPLPQHHPCRGCHQAREQMPPPSLPQQQLNQQQQQQPHLGRPHCFHQQQQQVILHHNTVQASVHPTHGVCYGDDTTHPQSPQHYNPPPVQSSPLGMGSLPAFGGGRHFTTMPHIHEQPTHLSSPNILDQNLCFCSNSPERHQAYSPQHQCCPEEILDGYHIPEEHPLTQPPAYPSIFRPQNSRAAASVSSPRHEPAQDPNQNAVTPTSPASPKQPIARPSDGAYPPQQPSKPLASSSSSSSSHHLPRHSYRDSGVVDVGQTALSISERPDSQASTSSTTDSEDSGFRSSHCTAQHGSKLAKQGNPLLKPLRRPKQLKARPKTTRAGGGGGGGEEDLSIQGATPLSTLNPKNLQCQVPASNPKHHTNVIQTTSLLEDTQGQRSPPRILQQQNALKCASNSIPETSLPNPAAGNYQNDTSACHSMIGNNGSSQDVNAKQPVDMTGISTHISWKYLQDLSVSSNSSQDTSNSQDGLQICHNHTSVNKTPQFQAATEPQIEMFGYSIV